MQPTPFLATRRTVALFLAAEAFIVFLSLVWCASLAEALLVGAVPGLLIYAVLFRRDFSRRLSWQHGVYLAGVSVLVAAALVAYAWMSPHFSLRVWEVLAAIYFVAALHVVVWSGDQITNALLSKAFGVRATARRPRSRVAPKTALRIAVVITLAAPLVAAAISTHWVKFGDSTDPGRLCHMTFEPVAFVATDGVKLRGWFLPATRGTSDTAVVVVPGRGMGKACLLPQAKELCDGWLNVLVMDLRGEGDSDGHTRGFGVVESQDVVGAVNYLRATHPRESRHVFALGVSQGASAVMAAARADTRIEAVVADSAFPSPAAELEGITPWLPGPLGRGLQSATLAWASVSLGCELGEADARRDVAGIGPRPLLLIHGEKDSVVPAGEAQRLYEAAVGPAQLWIVPDVGHGEALLARHIESAKVIGTMFRSVRAGLPPFRPMAGSVSR